MAYQYRFTKYVYNQRYIGIAKINSLSRAETDSSETKYRVISQENIYIYIQYYNLKHSFLSYNNRRINLLSGQN